MYWLRSSVGSDLLSLTANRSRSVLAVKGSLRRFAPWTAPGRSEGGDAVHEGKGGGRVDGPKGNLSVIPAALSRSRGALNSASSPSNTPRIRGGWTGRSRAWKSRCDSWPGNTPRRRNSPPSGRTGRPHSPRTTRRWAHIVTQLTDAYEKLLKSVNKMIDVSNAVARDMNELMR